MSGPYTREDLQSLLPGARNETVRHPMLQIATHLQRLERVPADELSATPNLCEIFADFARRFNSLSERAHGRLPAGTLERPGAIDHPNMEGGGQFPPLAYDAEKMPNLADLLAKN